MTEVYRQRLGRALPGPIVAFGGDVKCALALGKGDEVAVFEPIGDLATPEGQDELEDQAGRLLDEAGAATLVCDKHPGYVSHRLARRMADERGLELLTVQHHRAHVAAVAAEHGLCDAPVIGLAFDGTGYGDDGTVWGGEFFVGSVRGELSRQGSFEPLTLCGGDAAVRRPWRIAAACLIEKGLDADVVDRWIEFIGVRPEVFALFRSALDHGLNCARTTSLGRWFDCFAALWGVKTEVEFEGQAAIELQGRAETYGGGAFLGSGRVDWVMDELAVIRFDDFLETVEYMLVDWSESHAAAWALQFHASVAEMTAAVCARFAERTGARRVLCGGGCFLNSLLCDLLDRRLAPTGLERVAPAALPPGDQAIALGQVVLADVALRREGT